MKIRKRRPFPKLNLIPIMDSVFIFIFFLLMSAQFMEIVEIGTDLPIVSEIPNKIDKKDILNLILEIKDDEITIKTGINETIVKTISKKNGNIDFKELRVFLITLKRKWIEESSVILRPEKTITYKQIVPIIDACRSLTNKELAILGKSKKGKEIKTRTLFDQVIFDSENQGG